MRKMLDLDTSLTNYANPVKPKIPANIRNMPKLRAGPFRILHSVKTRPEKRKKSTYKGFLENKSMYTSSRDATVLVLHERTDTISVNLKFETTVTNTENTAFSRMLTGTEKSETSSSYECKGMDIYLPGDSSPWRLILSQWDTVPGNNVDGYGDLIRGGDTIQVHYATGFKSHEKLWRGYPTGLILKRNERQIAAFQFRYKKYIWISSREEKRIQQLLGSFILVYLSMNEQ